MQGWKTNGAFNITPSMIVSIKNCYTTLFSRSISESVIKQTLNVVRNKVFPSLKYIFTSVEKEASVVPIITREMTNWLATVYFL